MRRLARRLVPLLALLPMASCNFGAPRGATTQGHGISNLYHLMFYAAIAVAAVVYGLILWSLVRYRRRGDDLPSQFRYNLPLEIAYTVIPILIVGWLFYETWKTEQPIDRLSTHPAVVVKVTGFQWQWRFDYPAYGISIVGDRGHEPTLVLPAGRTVRIVLVAADVDHAFFVPEFLFKRDAIPGVENRFDLTIPEPGTFRGECAEFCGLYHADMNFVVKALPPSRFKSWASSHGSGGGATG